MTPVSAAGLLWDAWLVSWLIASSWSSMAIKRPERRGVGAYHWFITFAGLATIFYGYRFLPPMGYWPPPAPVAWAFVALTGCGFLFAWWARLHLGRLWSGDVTLKADHKVVDTGPYRLVRHPIYTGLILSAFATAFAIDSGTAILGAVIVMAGFFIKARVEERFLSEELGADAYAAYRKRVPMLVPFLPVHL